MTFDRAWRTFVEEELQRHAPAELETRVQRAVATRPPRRLRRPRHAIEGLALAASIVAAAWSITRSENGPTAVAPNLLAGHRLPLVSYAASVSSDAPRIAASTPAARKARLSHAHAPVLRASNGTTQEALQLVRLRMPRQALATLGVILIDPEAAGVVHVDVLIGEDGLPRDIRKVWFEP
jgi:hypothetical protein